MKSAVTICRILVGLLFIFSGLIKANDPLGLSYKMEEFFQLWNMEEFNHITLTLSVLMNAFEIIAGFALLIGWHARLFTWLLLLLIVFFTFLTGYAYFSGKFKNCGCFGDCLPITAKTSFLKDVALTLMIGFLAWHRDKIKPLFSRKAGIVAMLLITVFSFGFQWYTLNYLPVWDCLPFKKKNSIPEQMKMPANAVPDSTVITFVYQKDGKQVEFTADKFPDNFDSTYKFISRYDKVVRPGKNNQPPITGFALTGITKQDSTQVVLEQPYAVVLFFTAAPGNYSSCRNDFEAICREARSKNIPVYAITNNMEATAQLFNGTEAAHTQIFTSDITPIRSAARTNPCLYLLKQGTVAGKWSYKTLKDAFEEIKTTPAQPAVAAPAPDTTSQSVIDSTGLRP